MLWTGWVVATVIFGVLSGYLWRRQRLLVSQLSLMSQWHQVVAAREHFQQTDWDPVVHVVADRLIELLSDQAKSGMRADQLQSMLGNMSEGVLLINDESEIVWLNASAARLLGRPITAACGRGVQEVVRNGDLQRLVEQVLSDRLERVVEFTLRQMGQDGRHSEELNLQARGVAMVGTRSTAGSILVVINDVSQIHESEQVRREFVANVSHELKTPVSAIKGAAETIESAIGHDEAAAMHFLGIVQRQADRLQAIIEDLLSLARLDQQAETPIDTSPVQVHEILHAACESCEYLAGRHGVHVEVVSACSPVTVALNSALIEQAVVNLLENAIKYGGSGASVVLDCRCSSETVEIIVADNGPGIDEKYLPRLFDRFYRPDDARTRECGGTGLGLAIVEHVARVHGGHVQVDSQPGAGSEFRICLPNGTAEAIEYQQMPKTECRATVQESLSGLQ